MMLLDEVLLIVPYGIESFYLLLFAVLLYL